MVKVSLSPQASQILSLIDADRLRRDALTCVAKLALHDCYIAAGFVRNLVWDHIHHKHCPTPLNDIDVIYFDPTNIQPQVDLKYEMQLKSMMPALNWQVRNQARMHKYNGDSPYQNCIDAMSFWPEKETAVGVGVDDSGHWNCIGPFGFETLFEGKISYNAKRELAVFEQRLQAKQWQVTWPELVVCY